MRIKRKRPKSPKKAFDRAYDKCAVLRPGQTVTLSKEEEEALSTAIRLNEQRRKEAIRRYKEMLNAYRKAHKEGQELHRTAPDPEGDS